MWNDESPGNDIDPFSSECTGDRDWSSELKEQREVYEDALEEGRQAFLDKVEEFTKR